ncbi:MAG: hypothetical protein FJ222_11785 [Lentisphaerae bacterium]|nr:hypothetical protein [Lentisphaerota bacterium]
MQACCGCGACVAVCPCQCLTMQRDGEGFDYPLVDQAACVDCGLCRRVCPALHPNLMETPEGPDVYAAAALDDPLRAKSSSGGIFSVIANWMFSQRGVVYGAAFVDGCRKVRHVRIDRADELDLLRRSKYVQSTIVKEVYAELKNDVQTGRKVLFVGTPCQVAAIKNVLGAVTSQVLSCDLICHGVGSPSIFESYIDLLNHKNKGIITECSFRDKSQGWSSKHRVSYRFASGKSVAFPAKHDLYLFGFLDNLFLRPVCHSCRFASAQRPGDLTLGDFWGIAKYEPEWDDGKGTSALMVNSETGRGIWNAVSDKIRSKVMPLSVVIAGNRRLQSPSTKSPLRDAFFGALNTENFEIVMRKYCQPKRSLRVYVGQWHRWLRQRMGLR